MRNAESQCEYRVANDIPLQFRIPHSPFRIQGSTLSFRNLHVTPIRPTNRDSLAPVTCPALRTTCTPASAVTEYRGRASSAAAASRSVRCPTPARNVRVVSYAATGGGGCRGGPRARGPPVAAGGGATRPAAPPLAPAQRGA